MAHEKQARTHKGESSNVGQDSEKASEAGRMGGAHSHGGSERTGSERSGSQQSGSHQGGAQQGASQKGGTQQGGAQQGGSQHEGSGSRSASGNFANDHDKAGDAGRKGGAHSHGDK